MDLDIRRAILANIKDNNEEQLQATITDSIDGREVLLPGLGVLFELIWKNASDQEKHEMVDTLAKGVQTQG
ncbi:small acid-soluble spore protein SspI [Terribacillus saccharophilus]|jgi:small acid-soluble spore protein I (minor)|uniref:Small, acid-soluble spore protein I n=1 Tax=Terribacillus saccharophilus TaxID=361277 RepID=A0A268H9P1_9BACI|nr:MULTISPECIES: small acid-soluble spore protein SspI [Terribacillus]PAD33738.1 small acid-soluble spore protein SspI [Terribacillus saccharophilus]PAD95082.1 small acid-soluble spore protein SspI [Terribacillus saccharophilus]PAE00679.1 small acid-soluble spore protein SspI [Terribacillus saccharophilus]PAE06588.1 small acid-soluble spore protein SspI [Terribacillus saccharophilus]VVM32839.1 small acid-soluble spore protein SspI [Terribacillus sp. AE2B 122]